MTNPKHTDTSRSGDLVANMRDTIREWERDEPRDDWFLHQHDFAEAADRIEELDRHLTLSGKVSKALSERIEALEAEVRRKDAALRLFLALVDDPDYDFGELCEGFVPIARAALGEKQ